jgi:hypothetical protein
MQEGGGGGGGGGEREREREKLFETILRAHVGVSSAASLDHVQ